MSNTKQNKAGSVREQWTRQRLGDVDAAPEPSLGGKHFATPSPAPEPSVPAKGAARAMDTGDFCALSPKTPSSPAVQPMKLDDFKMPSLPVIGAASAPAAPKPTQTPGSQPSAAPAAPAAPEAKKPNRVRFASIPEISTEFKPVGAPVDPSHHAGGAPRNVKIAGISGELPVVKARSNGQSRSYSRYNVRYVDRPVQLSMGTVVESFAPEPQPGAPAYSWLPFGVYAGVSALLCAAWCLFVKLTTTSTPVPGSLEITLGIGLLVLIVVAGVVLISVVTSLSTHTDAELDRVSVLGAAMGKTALMMLISAAIWFGCMLVVTML